MKRVFIVLTVLLLFSMPNMAQAEQEQELHTIWNIPWTCTADEFLGLVSEYVHVDFERRDSGESISSFSSKAGGIPFFGFDVESADANFTNNEFAFAFICFPEHTAFFYDIKQLKDTIEKCVQDFCDIWSALTKEYGSCTNAYFYVSTDRVSSTYKVPLSDGAPDWDALCNIIWDAIHVSDEFGMDIQWNNVHYNFKISIGKLRSAARFSSMVAYGSSVRRIRSQDLLVYKPQYVPGFTPPEFTGYEHAVHMDDLHMRIKLPDYLNVYEMGKQNGFVPSDIVDDMELPLFMGGKVCLVATDEDESKEIMIVTTDIPQMDGDPFDHEVLFGDISPYSGLLDSMGVTLQARELYTTDQAKFFRVHISIIEDGITMHQLAYFTICGGKVVYISYSSFDGEITPADDSMMEGVVDSIAFVDTLEAKEAGTYGTVYTDTITKATFIIPAGWYAGRSAIIDGLLTATFLPDKSTESIVYVSGDGWAVSSEARKAGHTRSEYNNSHWSESEVANMYGLTEDKVSTVIYNGAEYFKLIVDRSDLLPEGYTGTCMMQMSHMENGYTHAFFFAGDETSAHYPEFEALLNSVEYAE